MPPTTTTDVETPIPVTPRSLLASTPRYGLFMLRPGQPGALYFNEYDVSEFLRRWNIEYEDASLTGPQKCQRIRDYCSPEVKEVVELLPGYDDMNWAVLEKELKNMYWHYDGDTQHACQECLKPQTPHFPSQVHCNVSYGPQECSLSSRLC